MTLDPLATWCGILISDLTRDQLISALAQKCLELRFCYDEMRAEQMMAVVNRMNGR